MQPDNAAACDAPEQIQVDDQVEDRGVTLASRKRLHSLQWGAVRAQIRPYGRTHAARVLSDDSALVFELCESAAGATAGAVKAVHGPGVCSV